MTDWTQTRDAIEAAWDARESLTPGEAAGAPPRGRGGGRKRRSACSGLHALRRDGGQHANR